MKRQHDTPTPTGSGISRRDFLKISALLGGSAALAGCGPLASLSRGEPIDLPLVDAANSIQTVCLQCNTGCGLKVKLLDGVAAKLEGNPYSPWTMEPPLPYTTPISSIGSVDGALCPKGQAGIQTAYDPYRLTRVLKRKPGTPRGAGQWITIDFEQAITEIVEGGDLFGEGPVEGLRALYALKDAKLAKAMAAAVNNILAAKPEEKPALVEQFKRDFAEHLDVLIDPDHPDLGPKNNQFAFIWGRLKNGRGDLVQRFVKSGFGSVNANGHTTVCQGSLYFTGKAMSEQFDPATGKFTGGQKFYWQADLGNAEFVLFAGTNHFEANYGPTPQSPRITQGVISNRMRYVVLDPRLSKLASKAWKWIPIKPGTDGAFAMGMIRWIIEQQRYNATFLAAANKAAAAAIGEPSWTNATWLVKIKDGTPGKFLRASDIGLTTVVETTDAEGKKTKQYVTTDGTIFAFDPFVALVNGAPTPIDPNNPEATPVMGDLLVNTEINGIQVKSGLQIIYEAASVHTIAEWAAIADVTEEDIIIVAREFTSHGTRAVADIHRGASQHTNGFYTNFAFYTLNALIGNFDHRGGLIKPTTYDRLGSKAKGPFLIEKMNNGANVPFGIDLLRTNTAYEKSTLFNGYPARRPWFPLATDVYQEDVPSMGDAYPYQIKVAMFYMSAINYALPAAQTVIEILADPKKIPLIITSDIMVGETSTYADYIFPDLSFLERWEFHGSHPSVPWKVENIRQPAMSLPHWPTVKVFGEEIPLSFEALVLAIAERLDLPGFGPNGFGEGIPFTRPEHLYLKMVANIAFGEKEDGSDGVPPADDEELDIFRQARRFLPPSVFDEAKWRAAVGDNEQLWRQTVYVLNRGGRYQAYEKGWKGHLAGNPYAKQINLYQEKTASTINSMTGEHLIGYPTYIPASLAADGTPIVDEGYDLHLITYKEAMMAKARGIADYWLLSLMPENAILINRIDAERLGLRTGDRVRISSASNPEGVWDLQNGTRKPMIGKVKVIEGIRPGVIAFPLGWGHFASGASEIVIDGVTIPADPRRAAGVHANAAMRVDPVLKNVTLSDLVGGSAVFYDSKVKLEKVG
ncbi:MAG: molybdopterin oxidoreductase [Chloroflexus sp.]|uniref:molybdopterin-dependent oxidoreductase n=1 Tax=Chloroflexus sp. TaxID=1904827 RepID=UPI0021DDA9DB|nr:molybdopterin-dependent oxidoreductase [Chloroflexus sp.]GIV89820.1 MAG: molybdopterin oxidoreductase [Chloroflexus sp.]